MTAPATLDIGVIGCGHWGPNHIRVFNSLPGCRIVAVSDRDPARLKRAQEVAPNAQPYTEASRLLASQAISAVVIVTPTATHFSLVSEALRSGKHVLCEKPLCLNAAEAEILVTLARERKLILMVGHIFLFNPGILKLKELIENNEIGEVRSLSAVRTNLGPVRSDVNAAWDLASHDIAIFNWLLGAEPMEVQAMGAAFLQPSIEDVVNINLRYPRGILATVQCSWLDPKKVRQMTVVGSKRMITWDDLALANPIAVYEKSIETHIEVSNYGDFLRVSMLDGDVRLPKVKSDEPLSTQNRAFVRAIREGTQPLSDGSFAAGVVRTLEKVSRSLAGAKPLSSTP